MWKSLDVLVKRGLVNASDRRPLRDLVVSCFEKYTPLWGAVVKGELERVIPDEPSQAASVRMVKFCVQEKISSTALAEEISRMREIALTPLLSNRPTKQNGNEAAREAALAVFALLNRPLFLHLTIQEVTLPLIQRDYAPLLRKIEGGHLFDAFDLSFSFPQALTVAILKTSTPIDLTDPFYPSLFPDRIHRLSLLDADQIDPLLPSMAQNHHIRPLFVEAYSLLHGHPTAIGLKIQDLFPSLRASFPLLSADPIPALLERIDTCMEQFRKQEKLAQKICEEAETTIQYLPGKRLLNKQVTCRDPKQVSLSPSEIFEIPHLEKTERLFLSQTSLLQKKWKAAHIKLSRPSVKQHPLIAIPLTYQLLHSLAKVAREALQHAETLNGLIDKTLRAAVDHKDLIAQVQSSPVKAQFYPWIQSISPAWKKRVHSCLSLSSLFSHLKDLTSLTLSPFFPQPDAPLVLEEWDEAPVVPPLPAEPDLLPEPELPELEPEPEEEPPAPIPLSPAAAPPPPLSWPSRFRLLLQQIEERLSKETQHLQKLPLIQEVRDHLFLAVQSAEIAKTAAQSGNLPLFRFALHNFLIDLHIAAEQRLSLYILDLEGAPPKEHHLVRLSQRAGQGFPPSQLSFLQNHAEALHWARYFAHYQTTPHFSSDPTTWLGRLSLLYAAKPEEALPRIREALEAVALSLKGLFSLFSENEPVLEELALSLSTVDLAPPLPPTPPSPTETLLDEMILKAASDPQLTDPRIVVELKEALLYLTHLHTLSHSKQELAEEPCAYWRVRAHLFADRPFKFLFTAKAIEELSLPLHFHQITSYLSVLDWTSPLSSDSILSAGISLHYVHIRTSEISPDLRRLLHFSRLAEPGFSAAPQGHPLSQVEKRIAKSAKGALALFGKILPQFSREILDI